MNKFNYFCGMKLIRLYFSTALAFLLSFTSLLAQDWKTLQDRAEDAYQQGSLQQAVFWAEKAVEKAKISLNLTSPEYTIVLENTAKLYLEIEQYEESEKLYLEIQQIRLQTLGNESLDYATCLDNLAMVYQASGNYIKAEAMLLISKQIREKTSSKLHPDYANTLDNLAVVYEHFGLYDKAEDLYWQSKDIREKIGGKKTNEYANILHNLAELYAKQKESKKAEIFYKDCLLLTQKLEGKNSISYATTLDGLAALYLQERKYAEAKIWVLESMRITEKIYKQTHTDFALNSNTLAEIYIGEKNYLQADSIYQVNLQIFAKNLGKQHHYYTNTLFNIAKLYEEQQKFAQASVLYMEVLERKKQEIDKVFPVLSENEKLSFYTNIKTFFNHFTNFALKYAAKNPMILCKVFENQLIMKGLLLNNLQKVRKNILSNGNANQIQNYYQWQQKREELAGLYYTNTKKLRIVEIEKLNELQNKLANEINYLEKQIETDSSIRIEVANTNLQKAISWQNYQQEMQSKTVAIEIIRQSIETDSTPKISYLALFATQNLAYPMVLSVENAKDLEVEALKFYQYSLLEQRTDNESYQKYWQPIQNVVDSLAKLEKIAKYDKIYVCPDGIYHQINLNTLLNTETGNYLADEQEIYLLSNLKDLLKNNDENALHFLGKLKQGLCVLLACPMYDLPASQVEIMQIDSILHKNSCQSKVYLDSMASEEMLKKLQNPILLHFATHGFFGNLPNTLTEKRHLENLQVKNPLLFAGLLLGKNSNVSDNTMPKNVAKEIGKEDGILTAYEVVNLSLEQTELVVLSACETGVGQIYDGEGIFGLQRAFAVAGAKNLLMSLWKVNDRATQLLMSSFYEFFLQNTNKKHFALLQAQKKVREKYPHPYFWGAFVLIGN